MGIRPHAGGSSVVFWISMAIITAMCAIQVSVIIYAIVVSIKRRKEKD